MKLLGYKTLLTGWCLMAMMWVLWGLSYWATLRSAGAELDPIATLPLYTAAVTSATVAGFMVLVMPGGIGPRETVLVMLIAPCLEGVVDQPKAVAVASVAIWRLVQLVSELVLSIILYGMGKAKDEGRVGP